MWKVFISQLVDAKYLGKLSKGFFVNKLYSVLGVLNMYSKPQIQYFDRLHQVEYEYDNGTPNVYVSNFLNFP